MKISRMSIDDIEQVTNLAIQLGYQNSVSDLIPRFAKINSNPGYALFVAKDDLGQILGWIQVNAEPDTLLVGDRADIAALVVHEKVRGQGIGSSLVKRAEDWARERDLNLIRVKSNVKREGAHRFYLREGFAHAKTSNMYVKDLVS